MSKENKKFIVFLREFIKSNALQILLTSFALLVTLFNLFLANKLLPITLRLNKIDYRVSAAEKELEERKSLTEGFIRQEQTILYIKEKIDKLELKVDKILER